MSRRVTVQLSDFRYELPDERIAQTPVEPRDAARLLVDRGDDVEHRRVRELDEILRPGDVLVVNETRVLPARLRLRRHSGGAVEVLLLDALDVERRRWEALVRPGGKVRVGEELLAGDRVVAEMGERTVAGDTFEVVLVAPVGDDVATVLDEVGEMPLPPYIHERLTDTERYQTVYAAVPGSSAAPTAGLHFTDDLLGRLGARGVERHAVELVVGLDTFQPISTDDPLDHPMHTERYRVPDSTWQACQRARDDGRRVVAVGTTAVRALESAARHGVLEGRTDLFIHRGFDWRVVDAMMTNFHLSGTTLLMMIDAFVGPRWRELYEIALDHGDGDDGYRFLSFGDAMLLERATSGSVV